MSIAATLTIANPPGLSSRYISAIARRSSALSSAIQDVETEVTTSKAAAAKRRRRDGGAHEPRPPGLRPIRRPIPDRSKPKARPNLPSSSTFAPVPQPQSSSRGSRLPAIARRTSGVTKARKPRNQK